MRRYYRLIISTLIGIALTQSFILSAQEYPDEGSDFFSFEKYRYTYLYFYNFQNIDLSAAGSAQRRIRLLAENFVNGYDALRKDQTDKAILQFQKSSRLLPEYFHIDFITALAYEKNGDFEKAARSYKSYLKKLKKFQKGMYRLSQPLIEKTVNFNISDYEEAEGLIGQRMAKYGIDMQKVSFGRHPLLLIIIYLGIAGAILYSATKTTPVKRIIYKSRAKLSRSKDSWICLYCGKENANINIRCYSCGKAK